MTTYDFQLQPSTLNRGVTCILAYNEQAYNWLTEEFLHFVPSQTPYCPMFDEDIEDFRNKAEDAHFICEVA